MNGSGPVYIICYWADGDVVTGGQVGRGGQMMGYGGNGLLQGRWDYLGSQNDRRICTRQEKKTYKEYVRLGIG